MQDAHLALKAVECAKGSTEHYPAQGVVAMTWCPQKLEVADVSDAIGAA